MTSFFLAMPDATVTDLWFYLGIALAVLTAVVHVVLALGVLSDAAQRVKEKKPLIFVGAGTWALATLLSGLFGVLVYWFIHQSALRKLYNKESGHD